MENTFVLFLNAYSALIQALATVALVTLTVYYVQQVKRSAIELEQTRKSEFLPMLSIRMEANSPRTLDVYLSNIGRGLAQNLKVSLPFERSKEIKESVFPGGKNVQVTFENVGIPEILELPEEKRLLTVEYNDIFGRTVASEAHLVAKESPDGSIHKQTLMLVNWHIILPDEK